MATVNITVKENTGRQSSQQIRVADNVADADIDAYLVEMKKGTLGLITNVTKTIPVTLTNFTLESGAAPAAAQRGQKFHISVTGTGDNDTYSTSIPCADPSLLTAGTDSVDIGAAPFDTIVSTLEAIMVDEKLPTPDPVDVNSITYKNYSIQ